MGIHPDFWWCAADPSWPVSLVWTRKTIMRKVEAAESNDAIRYRYHIKESAYDLALVRNMHGLRTRLGVLQPSSCESWPAARVDAIHDEVSLVIQLIAQSLPRDLGAARPYWCPWQPSLKGLDLCHAEITVLDQSRIQEPGLTKDASNALLSFLSNTLIAYRRGVAHVQRAISGNWRVRLHCTRASRK